MDARTRENGRYDAVAARAHPNDDAWSPKTSSQTRLDHPQRAINNAPDAKENELAPPPDHGSRYMPRIEPQKAEKVLTSITGIFLLRPARFEL